MSQEAALLSAVFYAVLVAYFVLYSRRHLVAQAPEEEFEGAGERCRASLRTVLIQFMPAGPRQCALLSKMRSPFTV